MKTLLLVRHAKSNWDQPGLADHDRPLNHRGRRDAPDMARRLAERGLVPDVMLSSSAVRARTTAVLLAGELGFDPERIVADERLYAASVDEVLTVIGELGDEVSCAMVVGHNPEIAAVVHRLSNEDHEMPTGAVAEFTFEVETWAGLGDLAPVAVRVETPRT